MKELILVEMIERKIYLIRGHKVMLDSDLSEMYEVETRALIQAVKRNPNRFPPDFMFQLNYQEVASLRSQSVISNSTRGGRRYPPYAFNEQGVAMLSSVLSSERAIEVNVAIMRAFVKLREMIATHKDLAKRLDDLEKKYDSHFKVVFDAIRQLMMPPEKKKRSIGFRRETEKVE
jgi:phage regulator Rha-like protein